MSETLKIEDLDPNTFSYKDLKTIAKENGITIKEIATAMGLTSQIPALNAKRNDGISGVNYYHVLVGLLAIRKQRKSRSKIRIIDN